MTRSSPSPVTDHGAATISLLIEAGDRIAGGQPNIFSDKLYAEADRLRAGLSPRVTDDGLVERVAAIIRELDAHGDKDDAAAIRALLAAASDRDVLVEKAAKAIQQARDEIGATEQQRIAFAYAEAAMREALSVPLAGEL